MTTTRTHKEKRRRIKGGPPMLCQIYHCPSRQVILDVGVKGPTVDREVLVGAVTLLWDLGQRMGGEGRRLEVIHLSQPSTSVAVAQDGDHLLAITHQPRLPTALARRAANQLLRLLRLKLGSLGRGCRESESRLALMRLLGVFLARLATPLARLLLASGAAAMRSSDSHELQTGLCVYCNDVNGRLRSQPQSGFILAAALLRQDEVLAHTFPSELFPDFGAFFFWLSASVESDFCRVFPDSGVCQKMSTYGQTSGRVHLACVRDESLSFWLLVDALEPKRADFFDDSLFLELFRAARAASEPPPPPPMRLKLSASLQRLVGPPKPVCPPIDISKAGILALPADYPLISVSQLVLSDDGLAQFFESVMEQ